jgi:mannan endo-1,4-beta-mannosidase
MGAVASSLLPANSAISAPLYGINAYYLLTESYRRVRQNPQVEMQKTILKYLRDDLGLAKLRDKSKINAIRFWAFNNYPTSDRRIVKNQFDFDVVLWKQPDRIDRQVLESLEIIIQSLAELEFYLVPVLSNYWIDAGGILRYVEWANRIKLEDWFDAYCHHRDEDYYLKHSMDFYTIPEIEKLFQLHISPVIKACKNNSRVAIIDVMNEPRGKSHYSQSNQKVKDDLYSHQIVAQWLNRQARFINKRLPKVNITTGEEGWLNSPVDLQLNYLKNESQYYEGIDLKTNLFTSDSALTMGSIHMYTHEAVEMQRQNECGKPFRDRRGWDYLLQSDQPKTPDSYLNMGEEWIKSRAAVFGNKPWYLGEMGWCRCQSQTDRSPLPATALQKERIEIYRNWAQQSLNLGAKGIFLWLLDGLEHRDEFYGMDLKQIIEIFPQ